MPAWVKDLQTNRRLATLVSLTGQLRAVLDGTTAVETQEENVADVEKTRESEGAFVDHADQKTEESLVENTDMEIQEASTIEDHISVMEEVTDDRPCEQDNKGVTENIPDELPCTNHPKSPKTVLRESSQGSALKNPSEDTDKDVPALPTPTMDKGKRATKKQGSSKQKCSQLTLRARTKKSYAEDNDSSENEKEQEEVVPKSPDPYSVFDFHGSPTRKKKSSKKTGKKLKNQSMFNFFPAPSQQGQRSVQGSSRGSGRGSGRRFSRVTKEGLADKNQQWGFSNSGRKKKVGKTFSPRKSQLENSFVRRVCFADADEEENIAGTRDEGIKEAVVEEKTGQKRNKGVEEAKMEGLEEYTEIRNEGIEEAVMEEPNHEDTSTEDEQNIEQIACEEVTNVPEEAQPVKDKMDKTGREMPDEHLEGADAALQEDGSKGGGKEEVTAEVENTSTPDDIEMLPAFKSGELQEKEAASPSTDEETGKKKRRRSGRRSVRDESSENVDVTSDPSASAGGSTNSPQGCNTPKTGHNKKRKSPTVRKTLLPAEENDSKPLKKAQKEVAIDNDSPKEAKEEGAKIRGKARNVAKEGSRVSISPSTPQSRGGSKGRRSSVLTPRGQRSSPRGSPGHVMKRNVRGETPLHLAAIKGDAETVLQLLQEGADPNVRDNAGWTPLHEASNHGHTRVAEVLLDYGALINTTAFENDSPLHDAVVNGRVEVARLLVSRGASLDVRNKLGHLPGDLAVTAAMKEALNTKPLHTQPQVVMTTSSQVGQVVALATGLDSKQREALEQCMLVLDGKVVKTFDDQVTHLVAACDDTNRCPRTIKYLQGVLTGKWIVSCKWVSACLEEQQHVPEGSYEVLGTLAKPDSTGAGRGRLNKEQQLPGLFDGCQFFLHGKFQPPTPPRKELVELIRAGGGAILAREPKPDSDCLQASTTVAYHARKDSDLAHCSHFILYDEKSAKTPPRIRTAKLCTVPTSWLMDCVTVFGLVELPN
ncbi:BRCA1-associated RING domain protein 1-like [Branchiostoma lanceolatum]|uniref:BRCA1-associated RING domain protein 1-like n=1 Tax=Branchiostoma lanceolatum TaxID=7740 RepID=UPI003455800D